MTWPFGDARALYEESLSRRCALQAGNPNSASAKCDICVLYWKLSKLGGADRDNWYREVFMILKEMRNTGTMVPTDESAFQQLAGWFG